MDKSKNGGISYDDRMIRIGMTTMEKDGILRSSSKFVNHI